LFAAACLRRAGELFQDKDCLDLAEVYEWHADHAQGPEEIRSALWAVRSKLQNSADQISETARSLVMSNWTPHDANGTGSFVSDLAWGVASKIAAVSLAETRAHADEEEQWLWGFCGGPPDAEWQGTRRQESNEQASLLREVVNNPFRPSLGPTSSVKTWNDGTIPKIAQGIYSDRAFARMPILHDALLDAGCNDEALLSHCRNPEGHVRGCWALDQILARE
jgi:hypothetical protein